MEMEIITKVCKECNIEKKYTEFFIKKERYDAVCKVCRRVKNKIIRNSPKNKDKIKARNDEWNKNNKDYFRQYHENNDRSEYKKKYREDNKDKIREYRNIYYNENRDRLNKYLREYRKNNPDKIRGYYENSKEYKKEYYEINKKRFRERRNKYFKNRKDNEPLFKLSSNIRTLINISLTKRGYKKETKTYDILGCSCEFLMQHLQCKFEEWMNWDNYGLYNGELNYGWDIDHIIPISSAKTEEDIIKLNHYSNLQPLCGYTNRYIKKALI